MSNQISSKEYLLSGSLDLFAMNLFNELNQQEALEVTKVVQQGKFVFTVEKAMHAIVKLVPCKYEITVSKENSVCTVQFRNLDDEPVILKYIKAYFVLGGFKILSVYEELKEVKQFPDYVDSIVKNILRKGV